MFNVPIIVGFSIKHFTFPITWISVNFSYFFKALNKLASDIIKPPENLTKVIIPKINIVINSIPYKTNKKRTTSYPITYSPLLYSIKYQKLLA